MAKGKSAGRERWPDGKYREILPVHPLLPQLHAALKKGKRVILCAPPGSGKTTHGPVYVACAEPTWKIALLQQTRNATTWNGRRACEVMGTEPGNLVGWRIRGEMPIASPQTRLFFELDQAFTHRLRDSGGVLAPGTVTWLDEIHLRKATSDLALGVIKDALTRSPGAGFVVSSATMDAERLRDYVGNAVILQGGDTCYPVDTRVFQVLNGESHIDAAKRLLSELMRDFLAGTLPIPSADGSTKQAVQCGTVLLLADGKKTIRLLLDHVKANASKIGADKRFEALPCHAELKPDEQDLVQLPVLPGVLRFVAGTDIIRSSVTVQQTVIVVDLLRIKRPVIDDQNRCRYLALLVSKQEADQGRGRAGRTGPGMYIAISDGDEYYRLPPEVAPEMLRIPVTSVVLQIAALGCSARTFSLLDPPEKGRIDNAVVLLRRLGGLDQAEAITPLGEQLLRFPLDPERGAMLLLAAHLGVLAETIVLTSALQSDGLFYPPDRRESMLIDREVLVKVFRDLKARKAWTGEPEQFIARPLPPWLSATEGKLFKINFLDPSFPEPTLAVRYIISVVRRDWAGESGSDFVALVNAFRDFVHMQKVLLSLREHRDKDLNVEGALRAWCASRLLDYRKMLNAQYTVEQICEELEETRFHAMPLLDQVVKKCEFDSDSLTKVFLLSRPEGFGSRVRTREYIGPNGRFKLGQQSACDRADFVVANRMILAGAKEGPDEELRGGGYIVDFAAPARLEWLDEIVPQLVAIQRVRPPWYSRQTDTVVEDISAVLFGFEFNQICRTLANKAEAAATFASWLVSETWSPKLDANSPISAVLAGNREIADQAGALNDREEVPELSLYNDDGLRSFYLASCVGATRIAEIPSLEALAIPPIEKAVMEKILADNPDKIGFGTHKFDVSYRAGFVPRIRVFRPTDDFWHELPAWEIILPGGKRIEVEVKVSGKEFVKSANLGLLRERFAQRLAQLAAEPAEAAAPDDGAAGENTTTRGTQPEEK